MVGLLQTMEASERTPITSRSRQAVLERRAARASTPPRVTRDSKRATQQPQTELADAAGNSARGFSPGSGDLGSIGRQPPPLPSSTKRPAVVPQPEPEPNGVPLQALAPAQRADERRRTESMSRVRTSTMYADDAEDEDVDENSALLGAVSLRSDLEHNAEVMDKLIDDVKALKAKDAELERVQDELAQIDDEVDDSCETLATFISLTFLAPTFTWSHKAVSLAMTIAVWMMQALITYKLYANAKINDGGQVMLDLGSGYMEMNRTMASAECDGCCDVTIHSMECRLAMMDAFENAIFERKAGECAGCEFSEKDTDPSTVGNRRQSGDRWSSEVYDMNLPWSPEPNEGGIGLCFSEHGLANGWVNLFAGMMIIIITLIREIQEALGGIYVVKRLKYDVVENGKKTGAQALSISAVLSYVWVCVIVLFHCVIGVYLLYASFRRSEYLEPGQSPCPVIFLSSANFPLCLFAQ